MGTSYFSDWRTRTWTCSCGWTGIGEDSDNEFFDALFEVNCPKCGGRLTTITYPWKDDILRAAEEGNLDAIEMLPQVASSDAAEAELAYCRASIVDLPDLTGKELTFTFAGELSTDSMNPKGLILLHDGEELYREPSGFEWWRSILTVCELVIQRYGADQVIWMDPAEFGETALGDDLSASSTIKAFLTERNIAPPTGRWARED